MSDDVSIKISVRDAAQADLKRLRKDWTDLRAEIGKSTDPAQVKVLERALASVEAQIKDVQGALRKANMELDKQAVKAGKLVTVWRGVGKAIKDHATEIRNAGVVAAAGIALFAKGALSSFASVQDASSALNATFGPTGDAMISWAKRSGDAMNMSQQETLNALQSFSGYAKSAGLQGQQIATFSENLVDRAADLASYYGGSTADAIEALGAALRGEAEPARRYQVFVDDMALKQEYFALTGEKVTGTLTAQQKVLAAQSLIMRQTSVAQGDISRTSDSMANTMKDATQQWSDFQSSMGETVAIVAGPALRAFSGLLGWAQGIPGPLRAVGGAITVITVAAMIATPRIIATTAALKTMGVTGGGIVSRLKGIGGAIAGPLTGAMVGGMIILGLWQKKTDDMNAAMARFQGTVDATTGALNSAGLQAVYEDLFSKVNDDTWKTLDKYGVSLNDVADAIQAGGPKYEGLKAHLREMLKTTPEASTAITILGAALGEIVPPIDNVRKATALTDRAMKAAGTSTEGTGDKMQTASGQITIAGDAAKLAAPRIDGLSRAMGRLMGVASRQQALRAWRKSVKDFFAKPTKDAAYSAMDSFNAAFSSFKKGSKNQANYVLDNYATMKRIINNSGLSKVQRKELLAPLFAAVRQAQILKQRLADLNGTSVSIKFIETISQYRPMGEVKPATGGLIVGPGTGTSDSIPAMISNGEFVIRAAAVKAIGIDSLRQLNHADRMPRGTQEITLPPGLVGRDSPQIRGRASDSVTVIETGASGPLVGHMEIHPANQVDVGLELLRLHRQQQREQRTRYAATGRP